MDIDNDRSVISLMNKQTFISYKGKGIIHSGMLPKLENCFKALESGVKQVIITDSKTLDLHSGTKLTS